MCERERERESVCVCVCVCVCVRACVFLFFLLSFFLLMFCEIVLPSRTIVRLRSELIVTLSLFAWLCLLPQCHCLNKTSRRVKGYDPLSITVTIMTT